MTKSKTGPVDQLKIPRTSTIPLLVTTFPNISLLRCRFHCYLYSAGQSGVRNTIHQAPHTTTRQTSSLTRPHPLTTPSLATHIVTHHTHRHSPHIRPPNTITHQTSSRITHCRSPHIAALHTLPLSTHRHPPNIVGEPQHPRRMITHRLPLITHHAPLPPSTAFVSHVLEPAVRNAADGAVRFWSTRRQGWLREVFEQRPSPRRRGWLLEVFEQGPSPARQGWLFPRRPLEVLEW